MHIKIELHEHERQIYQCHIEEVESKQLLESRSLSHKAQFLGRNHAAIEIICQLQIFKLDVKFYL